MRDKTHAEVVEKWALKCKQDLEKCMQELTPFINTQIISANAFYKRLAKTRKGLKKIKKLKSL